VTKVKESLRSSFYTNWQYSLILGTLDHFRHFTLNWLNISLTQEAQISEIRN